MSENAYAVFAGGVTHTVKNSICVLLFVSGYFFAHTAHADQFNDLYYIDPGGVPDLTEEGQLNLNGGGGTGGGASSGGGSAGGSSGGSSSSGSAGGTSSGGSGSGSTAGGSAGNGASAGTAGGGVEEEEPEADALESLVQDGSISGGFGGVGGSVLSSESGSVVINGARVRSFLRKDPDIDEVLRYWKIGKGKSRPFGKTSKDRLTPGEYYALVAATLAADDEGLQEARFTARDFHVIYRSRGALFAFIPWPFSVRVFVVPSAAQGERVTVKFPWYHWFVREYFTRAELAAELEGTLLLVIDKAEEGEDIHAELFEAIVAALRIKVRTITDSILLK